MTIPGLPASFITTSQKINRPTTVSSALNAKKNALKGFQYPNNSKKRMPGWLIRNRHHSSDLKFLLTKKLPLILSIHLTWYDKMVYDSLRLILLPFHTWPAATFDRLKRARSPFSFDIRLYTDLPVSRAGKNHIMGHVNAHDDRRFFTWFHLESRCWCHGLHPLNAGLYGCNLSHPDHTDRTAISKLQFCQDDLHVPSKRKEVLQTVVLNCEHNNAIES